MEIRTKLIAFGAATALAVGIATYAVTASSEESGPGFGAPFLRHGMTGNGVMRHGMGPDMMGMGSGMSGGPGMMMGAGHDSATTAQLGVIHELLANHDRIKRTVTNLPDGIRTVTESDDPQTAQWIKTHVASMGERVSAGDDPGLPIETPSLHSIFRDKDKIRTTVETTEKGVVVVQTSSDPNTVASLQQHASEVTDLVQGGMAALHTAMMQNAGGSMHGGMMGGGMMHRGMMPGRMMHRQMSQDGMMRDPM
jgi:hypothetical protein